MDSIKNQRLAEYLVLSFIIAIGVPVCVLWGNLDGQRLAEKVYAVQADVKVPEATSTDMSVASPEKITKGRALFQTNCTACHGENADGKGPAAVSLVPPPRDFTDANAKWTRSRDPQDIFKTVSEGSPGTAMPPFSASLSEEERWDLAHYIGTLPGVKH